MAITVDYTATPWLITIPQSDLTWISGTRYQITVDYLWQLLRDYSDGEEGQVRPSTYRRIPATASTPAITEFNDNYYACQFENGAYSVDIINGNSNFRDVEVKNTVSVGTNNNTGFVGLDVWSEVLEGTYTAQDMMRLFAAVLHGNATGLESGSPVFKSLNGAKNRVVATYASGDRTVSSRDAS